MDFAFMENSCNVGPSEAAARDSCERPPVSGQLRALGVELRRTLMDAGRLSEVLAAAGLSEYEDELCSRLDALNAFAGAAIDKRSLLNLLKDAGCSKMGVRQKLATVLMCELASARPVAAQEESRAGDDFWGSMIQQSHILGGGDFLAELPPPSSAEACLLYTSPSPRDRTRSRMPSSA